MHFYRDEKRRVFLQEYCPEKRRAVKISRDKSRHMDSMSDAEVNALVKAMSEPVTPLVFKDLPIRKHFEGWLKHLEARGYDASTVAARKYSIERFVFQFFSEAVKQPDAKYWPPYSIRFYNWMSTEGLDGKPATASQIKAANTALRMFYKWLGEEGHVTPTDIQVRNAISEVKATPLPRPVTPEEVLAWAEKCEHRHVKVLGLVGYFFSLRPQESFALIRTDFRPGDAATALECSRVMKEAKLYDRFVVYVGRQQQNAGTTINSAKSGSNGWVACFNERAAKMIIATIREIPATTSVVDGWNNHKLYSDWFKHGIDDLTLKDLRRASLYHLGQYSNLTLNQLMKHARHRDSETTLIYCRRPDEQLEFNDNDFDLGV